MCAHLAVYSTILECVYALGVRACRIARACSFVTRISSPTRELRRTRWHAPGTFQVLLRSVERFCVQPHSYRCCAIDSDATERDPAILPPRLVTKVTGSAWTRVIVNRGSNVETATTSIDSSYSCSSWISWLASLSSVSVTVLTNGIPTMGLPLCGRSVFSA